MSSFKDLRILDNFYQTSAYFPMPTILISTLNDDGQTNLGSYSLCFPYYIAGKDYYAMLLESRNSSNTAQNILKRGVCALNFVEDKKSDFKEVVRLGFPGDTSKEKMENCSFDLEEGQCQGERPLVVKKSYQVFECTWQSDLENAFEDQKRVDLLDGIEPPYRSFNGITSKFGCHFILKIDKILMKEIFYDGIVNGAKANSFPKVPVDYGFRDSAYFWYTKFRKPIREKIPEGKLMDVSMIMHVGNKLSPDIKFTEEACRTLIKVPRIFLKTILQSCIKWALENKVDLITADHMKVINDKRKNVK